MSGIHYEIEDEFEEDFIEVDPKLICKYSGLLSIYAKSYYKHCYTHLPRLCLIAIANSKIVPAQ